MNYHRIRARVAKHVVKDSKVFHRVQINQKITPPVVDPYYTNAISPYEDDLIFHLALQELSGSTAEDSGPLSNDGAFVDGPLLAQDATPLPPYDLYVTLDGGTIEVPAIVLDGNDPWTCSLWCRFAGTGVTGAFFSLSDGTRDQEIRLLWLSSGNLVLQREVVVARSVVHGGITPTADNHIVATYDGATLVLYVNGASVGSVAASESMNTPTTPFTFGAGSVFGSVDGLDLAGLSLFGRSLEPAEVLAIYNEGVS